MNRRKFMAGLALLPIVPFLGLVKAESVDGKGGPHKDWRPTEQGQFRINARMFILEIRKGMKVFIFEPATEKNLRLFKTWLDEIITKIVPNCFLAVNYVASYNEEANLEVWVMIGAKSKVWAGPDPRKITAHYVTLRTKRWAIEQDGII